MQAKKKSNKGIGMSNEFSLGLLFGFAMACLLFSITGIKAIF